IRNEVDLSPFASALRTGGTRVAYPRVAPPEGLTFHQVDDPSRLRPSGRYQIPEPSPDETTLDPHAIDVVWVPGLAFGAAGHGVGGCAGYSDGLLPRAASARRIGVCFDFQLIERCPQGAHDQAVHLIVTELRVVTATPIKEAGP